jgi:nucleoid-associated protein EbfC
MSEGFDPQSMLQQALEMQQRLMEAQAEAAAELVEGSAGGGKVTITMTGTGDVTAVHIDPSVVVPDEVDMLEDLVLAALRDAANRVALVAQQQMGANLGDLFGGGGLAALFGGGDDGGFDDDDDDEDDDGELELPPGDKA